MHWLIKPFWAKFATIFFAELAGTVANENGFDLEINFVQGDIGTLPPSIAEYYSVQIGTALDGPFTFALGIASGSSVRNIAGEEPNSKIEFGDVIASVFTDTIQGLSNIDLSNALRNGNPECGRGNAVPRNLPYPFAFAYQI